MKQFSRFLLVGAINTLLGYGVIFACMYLLGLSPELSNISGYAVGLITSYALNRSFTFNSTQHRSAEIIRFLVVFLIAYASNFAALVILVHKFAVHAAVSQILASFIYIGISFLMNKHYVFKAAKELKAHAGEKTTINRCRFLIYCGSMSAAFLTWILGVTGLAPLDDHLFISTIFQGKDFGFYILPELGRFFPLTAQEYVLASKTFKPDPLLFYTINALKLLACGGVLAYCLTLTNLSNFGAAILWTTAITSPGIANTLFRLSAGELNAFLFLLVFACCSLAIIEKNDHSRANRNLIETVGIIAFSLALFYKELIFLFGLTFGASEYLRNYRTRRAWPPRFISITALLSLSYIMGYAFWRAAYATGSYAAFHTTAISDVLKYFAINDPFITLIVFPVTAYRALLILNDAKQHSVYDSFLLAASAYAGAFFLLKIFNTYYLLPAYGFGACGLAGVLARLQADKIRKLVLTGSFVFALNSAPVAISDIHAQKLIINNHYGFVTFLSEWLQHESGELSVPRKVVLAGVSPGNGIEIIKSLDTFLVSLGVPPSSVQVLGTEATTNPTISSYYGFSDYGGHIPETGDLLIYNPYQERVTYPALLSPSYHEIYRSASEWSPPRWSSWTWFNICLRSRTECFSEVRNNMRYSGYAAMLVTRMPIPVSPVPLESPSYRVGPLFLRTRMRAKETRRLDVFIENTGTEIWPANGNVHSAQFVNLAYRWFNEKGDVVLEGDRTPLPEPMRPNDRAKVSLSLRCPAAPGKYRLVVGPVQEGVRWFPFDEQEGKTIEVF